MVMSHMTSHRVSLETVKFCFDARVYIQFEARASTGEIVIQNFTLFSDEP